MARYPSKKVLLAGQLMVRARWWTLGVTLAAILASQIVLPHDLLAVLLLLGVLALLNGAAAWILRAAVQRGGMGRERAFSWILHGLSVVDLVLLSLLVRHSGGGSSPLLMLYVLYPGLLGAVLHRGAAAGLTAVAVVLLTVALRGSPPPVLGPGAEASGWRALWTAYPLVHLIFSGAFMVLAVYTAGRLREELEQGREGWRRRALELAVLHQVVEADRSSPDVDAWLGDITRILASTLYPEDVGFLFLDERGQVLRPHPSYHGYGTHPETLAIPAGAGITGAVVREDRPLLVPDVRRDSRFLRISPHVVAELCVPVRVEGRVVGVLNVESRSPGVITQEDLHLMSTIANHVGTVLARARVLESERAARRKAESLEQVAAVLNSTLEREELLQRVLEELSRLVPSASTSVQVLEGEVLRVVAVRGFREEDGVVGMTFSLDGDNPNRKVIGERRPLIIPDAPASYPVFRTKPHDRVRSWLGVPMVSRGKVIGMIALDRTEVDAFTPAEADTALAFANHVAIALENVGRYAATLYQAMTDELTGLYNRRYLRQELEREVLRSRRYQHPFSLIMVDLDDFKRYNDRYGHPAGDMLLKELAGVMREVVRPTDIAVRYGGEEFALILPETGARGAVALAERLRRAIADHRFRAGEEGLLGQVTGSLGVATFPQHAASAAELVRAADSALFCAKEHKNRVCLFGEGRGAAGSAKAAPS